MISSRGSNEKNQAVMNLVWGGAVEGRGGGGEEVYGEVLWNLGLGSQSATSDTHLYGVNV